ncbi:MAG: hypothetical protein ABFS38_20065 [Bacteroidota bacterium]
MKRIWIVLLGVMCFSLTNAQFRSVGLIAGAGYTLVDIEEAVQSYNLTEWDHFGVIIKLSGEYEMKPDLRLVGELGSNRLYYWEYYWSDGYYSGSRWRSEWTYNIGLSFKKQVGDAAYLQAGPGVHIFEDGSGTVLGLLLAMGYDLSITDQIKVPIGVRIEPVFGRALPTSLLIHTGIRYDL